MRKVYEKGSIKDVRRARRDAVQTAYEGIRNDCMEDPHVKSTLLRRTWRARRRDLRIYLEVLFLDGQLAGLARAMCIAVPGRKAPRVAKRRSK